MLKRKTPSYGIKKPYNNVFRNNNVVAKNLIEKSRGDMMSQYINSTFVVKNANKHTLKNNTDVSLICVKQHYVNIYRGKKFSNASKMF